MSTPSYGQARRLPDEGRPLGSGRPRRFGKAAAEERRRDHAARARAARALTWAYPDTYAKYVLAARGEIDAECGPLPQEDS